MTPCSDGRGVVGVIRFLTRELPIPGALDILYFWILKRNYSYRDAPHTLHLWMLVKIPFSSPIIHSPYSTTYFPPTPLSTSPSLPPSFSLPFSLSVHFPPPFIHQCGHYIGHFPRDEHFLDSEMAIPIFRPSEVPPVEIWVLLSDVGSAFRQETIYPRYLNSFLSLFEV